MRIWGHYNFQYIIACPGRGSSLSMFAERDIASGLRCAHCIGTGRSCQMHARQPARRTPGDSLWATRNYSTRQPMAALMTPAATCSASFIAFSAARRPLSLELWGHITYLLLIPLHLLSFPDRLSGPAGGRAVPWLPGQDVLSCCASPASIVAGPVQVKTVRVAVRSLLRLSWPRSERGS